MGRQQFDARAQSLPTHAIQSPLTRPFRSLGYDQAKRTATPKHLPRGYGNIEQGRASTAGRESKKQGTNRINIAETSRHASGEPTKPLRTRGAQVHRGMGLSPHDQQSGRRRGTSHHAPRSTYNHPRVGKGSFGAPESIGLNPHDLGPATNEEAADEEASRHVPKSTYNHPRTGKGSFGAPESMGLSPHDLGPATNEMAADKGASRHAPRCTYCHPRTASCAREASEHPRAWGSVPTHVLGGITSCPRNTYHNPCTTTYKLRCAQEKLRHTHGHGAQSPPEGHHTVPSQANAPARTCAHAVCSGLVMARGLVLPFLRRPCPSTKASNHARGLPQQLPSAGAIKAKMPCPLHRWSRWHAQTWCFGLTYFFSDRGKTVIPQPRGATVG